MKTDLYDKCGSHIYGCDKGLRCRYTCEPTPAECKECVCGRCSRGECELVTLMERINTSDNRVRL